MHPACLQLSPCPGGRHLDLLPGPVAGTVLLGASQTLSCISVTPAPSRLGWLKVQTSMFHCRNWCLNPAIPLLQDKETEAQREVSDPG